MPDRKTGSKILKIVTFVKSFPFYIFKLRKFILIKLSKLGTIFFYNTNIMN